MRQLFFGFLVACVLPLGACSMAGKAKDIAGLTPSEHRFTSNGRPIKVFAIPTGTIQIKHCHHSNCLRDNSSYPRRFLEILFSRKVHEERLPIYAYLIDHPDGRFLVDAGGDKNWNDDASWSCDRRARFVSRRLADVQTPSGTDLVSQLQSLGYDKTKISAAIITHLHFDHTASLPELEVPAYVGGKDLEAAGIIGAVTCKYFDGVKTIQAERLLQPRPEAERTEGDRLFGDSLSLTSDGNLRIYSTPGHTPGSLSISLNTDQGEIWFIGDTTFDDTAIEPDSKVAGMHFDIRQVRGLHEKLRRMLATQRSLLVPSHDKEISSKLRRFQDQSVAP